MIRVWVLGVGFDNMTRAEAVKKALELIKEHRAAYMVTPNPELVMAAWESESVSQALSSADLAIPDGIGIIMAARLLGTPLTERLPGIDIAMDIVSELSDIGGSVYLFGAKPGVAEKAAGKLRDLYPSLRVAGTRNGFDYDDSLIEDINKHSPDFLMVCLGAPKQELWMYENRAKLDVGLMAGLGGTLDVLSGETKRAPVIWQKLYLEWLYRCIEEPARFARIKKFPGFLIKAAAERARIRRNGKR